VRSGRREDGMKGRGNKGFLPLKGEGKERGARVEEERRERKGPWAGGLGGRRS